MRKKLQLKRGALLELSQNQLDGIAGAADVQTLQSGCQSGVAPCYPTYRCFTHTTSLDCRPTDHCPTNGCG